MSVTAPCIIDSRAGAKRMRNQVAQKPLHLAMAALLCVLPLAAQEPAPDASGTLMATSLPTESPLVSNKGARRFVSSKASLQPAAQPSRLFGFIPNYATVEGGASEPPLTTGGKFKLTLDSAFDPYEFAIVGGVAAMGQAQNQDPSLGQGLKGYSERYAKAFADQAVSNVMTGAILPSLLREDPRFYERGRGSFLSRFDYALSRIFVTRTDSGTMQFNYSEFVGNAAASGISNLYEPTSDRTLPNTLNTLETQLAIDAIAYEAKEFWPDIRHKILHRQ